MFLRSRCRRAGAAMRGATLAVSFALVATLFSGVAGRPLLAAGQQALQLNGSSQYATLGNTSQLRSATFTVELWFKRTGAGLGTSTGSGGIASAIPLITKGRADGESPAADINYFLGIDATSGKLVGDFEEGASGATPSANHPITGTAVIAVGATWHHAAATYDGSTWSLYLDGVLDGTLAVGRPANAATATLTSLGSALTNAGVAAGFFAGAVDEVRIWSVARTLAQINATRNTEITTPQTNLLGVWNLNEGSGTSLADNSGNAITGTAVGVPTPPTWTPGFDANQPPVAVADSYTTAQDTAKVVAAPGVLANDTDAESNPLTALLVANVTHGTLSLASNGGFTYTPTTTYNGPDSFTYKANDGTSDSNTVTVSLGVGNLGMQLNGTSQYATLGTTAQLRSATFTVELWFKRTGAGVGTGTGTGGITSAIPLITKGRMEAETAAADVNYFLGIDASSGKLVADFEEGQTGATPSANHPITATTVVTQNVWHHAAATYDGTTWNLYLDGILDGTLAVGATHPANAATAVLTTVGSSLDTTGTPAGFFAGAADEVRIWSVARTLSQINATRTVEVTSAQANLLGVWNLNEGGGTSLADKSGNGITGTAVGSPIRVAGFVVPDSTPPAAPTGLVATPTLTGIDLSWNANSESDLAGYNIYRGTTPGVGTGGTPINGALLTSPTYTDGSLASSSLTSGQTYYYVVTAVDTSANKSAASNEDSAVAPAVNRGLQLNGTSQYVTFGAAPGLDASSFTIELWFYQTGAGTPTSTGSTGLNAVPLVTKGRAEAEASNVDMNWFLGSMPRRTSSPRTSRRAHRGPRRARTTRSSAARS